MKQETPYWVRSKQPNEISGFGGPVVPAQFKTLEAAQLYRRKLNLRRGPYHPGYIVEVQKEAPFMPRTATPES